MKFQTLLTTLYYLLFSSSAKQINDTVTGTREARAPKNTIIYHNGHPIEVHGIPQQQSYHQGVQSSASNAVQSNAEPGPKVALQRDKIVIQNENSYLQDSYGNKFFSPPQQVSYKATFPQQYVALQDLPAQFSQPWLGTTRGKPAYTFPQLSFNEQVNRLTNHQQPNEQVFFDFGKASQSQPLTLPQQHLNIPIKTVYKIAEAAPLVASNNHPVTFSFHPSPSQRFVNFAPEKTRYNFAPHFHSNILPSSSFLNQRVQFDEPKPQQKRPNEGNAKLQKKQPPKKVTEPKQVFHTSEQLKAIDPKYFKPQVFSNPIVPQVQHFLPRIQNVLQYSIIPKPEVKIITEPEVQTQEEVGPVERQIHQIVSRPENKNKIVVNEYSPPEKHEHKEETKAEVIDEEENEEKNFDEGYEEAAKGFPTYSYNDDYAKKIFDAAPYGEPHYQESLNYGPPDNFYTSDPEDRQSSKYIVTGSVQHNAYGDDHPKEFKPVPYHSNNYKKFTSTKDARPSGKQPAQFDRSKHPKTVNKSEQHERVIPYHFGNHKQSEDDRRKGPSKSARQEIDYAKGYIQPNSGSHRLNQHLVLKSHGDLPFARFVEPQYQYGFEPILSRNDFEEPESSASNIHESEVPPSTMKKVYKENWFISKTSSTDAGVDV